MRVGARVQHVRRARRPLAIRASTEQQGGDIDVPSTSVLRRGLVELGP
jgi:hypothetical protein